MAEVTEMILKMTVFAVLYILVACMIWHYWSRHEHSMRVKIAIGVIFGLCSVLSTHTGVDYNAMILNLRDAGPLAAGLFFDPISAIIAGLIGGIERYIAGTYWGIGAYTTTACSISTCLAGLLAAVLQKTVYSGKRPPTLQCFFIGAVMEVFHMYAVLFTHRESMKMAYYVVKHCSVPMVLFCAIALAGCSIVIKYMEGEFNGEIIYLLPKEKRSIAHRFQGYLLAVTLLIFVINYMTDFNLHVKTQYQQIRISLHSLSNECLILYNDLLSEHSHSQGSSTTDETGNTAAESDRSEVINQVKDILPYTIMSASDDASYILYDDGGKIISCFYSSGARPDSLSAQDYKLFEENKTAKVFRANPDFYNRQDMLCIVQSLDKQLNLAVTWRYSAIYDSFQKQVYESFLADILLFTALYILTAILLDLLVTRNLQTVNASLNKIIGGNLNEEVSVRNSIEFNLLSDDINNTVSALKGYINESNQRMQEELKLAAFIQESALPHVFQYPRSDFEIYAIMDPARQIGGDFYDFFFTDVDRLVLVIADVSGKGIPAAMFMMRAKTAIVNTARAGKTPAEILYEVNNTLCEGNEAEMFVSVWIGVIDLSSGMMKCANAGHEYPIIRGASRQFELLKDKHNLVLAAMENTPIGEYELQMHPGDRLFVYTDGVPEAVNENLVQYGTDRLIDKLNTLQSASEKETLNAVQDDIAEFVGREEQFDDITMMGFTYFGR